MYIPFELKKSLNILNMTFIPCHYNASYTLLQTYEILLGTVCGLLATCLPCLLKKPDVFVAV